jgi:hypothetical protein
MRAAKPAPTSAPIVMPGIAPPRSLGVELGGFVDVVVGVGKVVGVKDVDVLVDGWWSKTLVLNDSVFPGVGCCSQADLGAETIKITMS